MTQAQPLASLADLADRYDALLCDVWGVIHDGKAAFPRACDALMRFRAARGPVLLLSNAPRPGTAVMRLLDGLNVPREAYDGVETSGDATRHAMAARPGLKFFHLGPERDRDIWTGLDVCETVLEEAELLLCTGLFDDDNEGPDDYRDMLAAAKAKAMPMICANPDIKVSRGARLIWCAGGVAAAYEAIGGAVTYFGKPHRPVYDESLKRLNALAGRAVDPARILAVGDGLRTDITGANRTGLDSLLITAGIHWEQFGADPETPDAAKVRETLTADGITTTAFMPRLMW